MKGFIIFQNETGQLLYSKNYNQMPFTHFQNPPTDTNASILKQAGGASASTSQIAGSSPSKKSRKMNEDPISADLSAFTKNQYEQDGNHTKFSKESVDYVNNQIDD